MKVTLKDVAERANVSISTASRVISRSNKKSGRKSYGSKNLEKLLERLAILPMIVYQMIK